MKSYHNVLFSALLAGGVLSACGGGGGSSGPGAGGNVIPPQSSARRVALSFTGTSTLLRRAQTSLSGTPVTIVYNGSPVGTGTLDANGAVTIQLESSVPAGATVSVTAGSITATVVLAHTMEDTAVLVQVLSNGTISVSVSGGTQPVASPSPADPNGSTETEDDRGDVESVDENNGNASLPANLPISVTSDCKTVTLTPLSSAIASARFEENIEDGDGGSEFKYEGAFTAAMTFPVVAQSARLRVELFDAQHNHLLDLKAPLSAFGITGCVGFYRREFKAAPRSLAVISTMGMTRS